MAYVALYRTWRPQDFDDLVGQAPIKKALTNALETGRISHAYLFAGPRGTGKTSTARILAKALNCEKGPTPHPCNQCENCREITEGTSGDVIEIDAASNRGIDEIRKIKIEHVSDRAKAHASVQDLIEEMEKNNPFGSMILDGCARNAFERPILPVEYPQDEAYQQMLNDMMVTNLQGEEEVAGANAYLRDRAEERRKNEQAQMQTRLKDDYVMPVTSEKGDNNYKANLAQVPAWRGGISNRAAARPR